LAKLELKDKAAIRWLLGQCLVIIGFAGCYTIDLGSGWLVSLGLGLAILGSTFPVFLERLPRIFWVSSPYLLLIWIGADFFLSGGDILPPLFRMVLLLTIYRSLQIRSPREDLQLLLLTLFLVIVTGVFSQDISFGLQLLFYAPVAICLLFMVNLSVDGPSGKAVETPKPIFSNFSWRRLQKHTRKHLDRRTLSAAAIVFLCTSALTFFLFILLPRFDIGASIPFPRLNTGESLSGFTDHVRFGDVISILSDDSIAMRVDVEMESPPARPYWRMVVLDAYYDGGFMASPKVRMERRSFRDFTFSFDEVQYPNRTDDSTWTLYMEGGISSYLPIGDAFDSLRFNNRIQLQLHKLTRVFSTSETNANTLSIRIEGMTFGGRIPPAFEDAGIEAKERVLLDTSDRSYMNRIKYPETLLIAPAGIENEAILEMVLREMEFVPGMPASEFSGLLVDYLRKGRGYSLENRIPGGEGDLLLRWVESGQAGHCELYAGAFVLVSRYAGYPTRMVTGYAGGDWNGFESYYMVRNRDAHAWCEIYSPEDGWLRVDPTPGYGEDPGSVVNALALGEIQLDRSWKAYLDSLRILWYRRIIQFDSEDQELLALSFKDVGIGSFEWVRSTFGNWSESLKRDWKLLVDEGEWRKFTGKVIAQGVILGMLIVMVIWLHRRRNRKGFEFLMRKRAGLILRSKGEKLETEEPGVFSVVQSVRFGDRRKWPEEVGEFLKRIGRLK